MNLYAAIRPLLFRLEPELAHRISLSLLPYLPLPQNLVGMTQPVSCMGLTFKNPVMLAAGLDKNADHVEALFRLGFSGIELGTVTPRPQQGNPQPRCFRVPQAQALINRMGFNNKGVDYLVSQLTGKRYEGIVGVNIGKNKETPNEKAFEDYRYGLCRVASVADYVTINVSSPNTPGLRSLQSPETLHELLQALHRERLVLQDLHHKRLPLALKITVDLAQSDISGIIDAVLDAQIDGLILSNTTINHSQVHPFPYGQERGGVSGSPLTQAATDMLNRVRQQLGSRVDLIGVGGIMSASDAINRVKAGATVLQLYTGLIYSGPKLVHDILRVLS